MNNNKGFTMVELLATVAILGILTSIAITAVSSLLNKAHEEYYNNQEKNLVLAAQAFYNSNKTRLPKVIGKKDKVTETELREANYLKEDLKNYDGKNCDKTPESYVTVFKYNQSEYSYTAYLNCGNRSSSETLKNGKPHFVVDFPLDPGEGKTYKDVAKAKINIKIMGNESKTIKLLSYSYIVSYSNGSKYIEVFNSGNKYSRDLEVSKVVDLSKYTIGGEAKIRVKITATNINGNTNTKVFINNYKDDKKPKCQISPADMPNTASGVKKWTNGPVKVTVGCYDGDGSGCQKDKYTKSFTNEGMTGQIKIKDNAGNTNASNDCIVTTYIDKTSPVVEVGAYQCDSKGEATGSVLKTVKATSGSKTLSSSDISGSVNGWLNKEKFPYGVCFKVKATDNFALAEELFSYNKANYKDSASGYKTLSYTSPKKEYRVDYYREADFTKSANYKHSFTSDGHRYGVVSVKDGASNTTKIVLDIKMDRVNPTKPTGVTMKKWNNNNTKPTSASGLTANYTNDTWSNLKVFTAPTGGSDALSGLDSYEYTTTGKTKNETKIAKYRNIEASGISYIQWRSVDKSGNKSDYTAAKTIKIDLKAPTIVVNAYKCDESKKATGESIGTVTADNGHKSVTFNSSSMTNNFNGWINNRHYPNGICFKFEVSDDSSIKNKTWSYNKTGYKDSESGYKKLDASNSPSVDSPNVESKTYSHSLTGQGHRYATFVVTDSVGNKSTVTIDMKMDLTNPSVSSWTKLSNDSADTYKKAKATASDGLSGLKSWDISTKTSPTSYSWTDSTSSPNTVSIGFQKSKSTSPNKYYYYVRDKAGNIGRSSSTVTQYKVCSKTHEKDAAVYKMSFKSNDCGNKRKKMNIHNIKCYGDFDKYNLVYCDNYRMTTKDSETNYGHSGNVTYIYYDSKDHCKQDIKTANTHVTKICTDGNFTAESDHPERFVIDHGSNGIEYQYHGYRFFTKGCTNSAFCDFSKFMGVWIHQPISKNAPAKYDARNTHSTDNGACIMEFKSMGNYDDYD